MSDNEAPSGQPTNDDYVSRPGQKDTVPVTRDDNVEESPYQGEAADSDAQLEKDEADAIDTSNIVEERTRGASKKGAYTEPGDEEGLPTDDGTSSGAAQ